MLPVVLPALVGGVLVLGFVLAALPWGPEPVALAVRERPAAAAAAGTFDRDFRDGVGRLRRGDAAAAAAAFERAVRARPEVPEAHVNLGYALLALNRAAAAHRAFEHALNLRPGQANAYFGLAESLESQGDLALALGAMRSFVHLVGSDDPHRRRALSAIWEWEAALTQARAPTESGGGPERDSSNGAARAAPDVPPEPSFALLRLDGTHETMARYAGKVLVLNVWATWCAPCRREIPDLERLSRRLDPRRFAVVGVSVDDDPDFVGEYLRDVGATYENYIDGDRTVTRGRLGVVALPETLIFGPDGRVAFRHVGVRDWDDDATVARLETVAADGAAGARASTFHRPEILSAAEKKQE